MPEALTIDSANVECEDEYPVSVTLRYLPKPAIDNDAQHAIVPNGLHRSNLRGDTTDSLLQSARDTQGTKTENVLAKYVVGCDGAHSWTRRQIGGEMEGEHTDYIWFVSALI